MGGVQSAYRQQSCRVCKVVIGTSGRSVVIGVLAFLLKGEWISVVGCLFGKWDRPSVSCIERPSDLLEGV